MMEAENNTNIIINSDINIEIRDNKIFIFVDSDKIGFEKYHKTYELYQVEEALEFLNSITTITEEQNSKIYDLFESLEINIQSKNIIDSKQIIPFGLSCLTDYYGDTELKIVCLL